MKTAESFGSFSLIFCAGQGVADTRFAWNKQNATSSFAIDGF